MEKRTIIILVVGTVLFLLLFIVLVVVVCRPSNEFTLPEHLDSSTCPKDLSPLPVILVSLDGFRADYFDRDVTPTLKQLRDKGVSAPYMTTVFPSLTLPNHYSMVTGLLPEWHGIISNSFYDPKYKAMFTYKTTEFHKARWWHGEPIWNTVRMNGLESASYFWVGSEAPIGGSHPTYWYKYNSSIPLNQRPAQVIEWLKMPAHQRPSWIALYANQPDKAGHKYGPDSEEVTDQLKKVDQMITLLLEGLKENNLLSCVNILVVSDHGMAPVGEKGVIHLDRFIPEDLQNQIDFVEGAFATISLKRNYRDRMEELDKSLSCQNDLKAFRREELPKRLHYSKDNRVGDYVLLADEGFSINLNSSFFLEGMHGYDNHNPSMQALFMAYGPAFKEKFTVEPFQTIELYNLMCRLLNIPPAPNNGTLKLLDKMLKNPPLTPEPQEEYADTIVLNLKQESEWRANYDASNCSKDDIAIKFAPKLLDINVEYKEDLEKSLCPWGIPRHKNNQANFVLLYHPDHVTGYSTELKLPLWTSFSVTKPPLPREEESQWLFDIRLSEENTPSCDAYDSMASIGPNWKLAPLFPLEFSLNETTKFLSFLISNRAIFTRQLQDHWTNLMLTLIPSWVQKGDSPLNVVVGPVFDEDSDGLMDDVGSIGNTPALPTEYFAVITRCAKAIQNLHDCPSEHLESLAFVYPQKQTVEVCWEGPNEFAQMFSVKIQDVELLTGLNLLPYIPSQQRQLLVTRETNKMW